MIGDGDGGPPPLLGGGPKNKKRKKKRKTKEFQGEGMMLQFLSFFL